MSENKDELDNWYCDEQQEDHTWEYKTGKYIEIEGGGELTTFLRCIDCGRILCIWRRISQNEIDENLAVKGLSIQIG